MLAIGKRQRVHKFQGQIVDSLMILSSSLRAGLSFLQAIEVLCEEMPAPVSQEFRLVLHEQKLGRSIEDALGNLRKRMRLEETNLVVSSILIARETGGDLPRVLSRLADTIRDNLKLKEKISTLTLQGRLQGVIMAMLPFAFAYFIYKQNPGHFDVMLETELGRKLLAGAAILQIVGIILIKKVSTMKF
jgi:tight adherence protein B